MKESAKPPSFTVKLIENYNDNLTNDEKMNYLLEEIDYIRKCLTFKGLWPVEFCKKIVQLSTYSVNQGLIKKYNLERPDMKSQKSTFTIEFINNDRGIENVYIGSKDIIDIFEDSVSIRTFKNLGVKHNLTPKEVKSKMRKHIDDVLIKLQADYMKLKYADLLLAGQTKH